MTETVSNELIYQVLQKMQGPLSSVIIKLGDVEGRMAALEEASSSMSFRIASVEVTVSRTHKRIDRIEHRLDRIETRLGLVEA